MSIDIGKILNSIDKILDLKNEIQFEIRNEQDAKRRKKLQKASDKATKSGKAADLIALRELLFKY